MNRALACLLMLLIGCDLPDVHFACDTADQCGAGGTCVDHGCAFASSTCDSGLRFDPSVSDGRAGTCVPMSDGGMPLDSTLDDMTVPPDLRPAPFAWTVSTVAGGTAELRAVFGVSSGDVYVAGTAGTVLHTTDFGMNWSPPSWAQATPQDFNGIWGFNAANVWVVGTKGTLLRANGSLKMTTNAGDINYGIWGSSGADIYTAGINGGGGIGNGYLGHSTDGSSFDQTTGFLGKMNAVWGASAARVFAVGDAGVIRFTTNQGMTWDGPTVDPASVPLYSVWGSGVEVWIVGYGGIILHSTDQGGSFSQIAPSPTTQSLRSVWGNGVNDIYVVGDQGTILHSNDDGATWHGPPGEGVSNLPVTNLLSVWGSSSDDVYIVGASGAVAHGHR